ncbi:MAG: undecaprenyl-phosphate glucose phosphotransferase [Beijerinckiaceae bacterium]
MKQNSNMMQATEVNSILGQAAVRQSRAAHSRAFFSFFAAITDTATIVVSALVVGWAYHLVALGEAPFNENLLQIGFVVALFVLIPNVARHEYAIGNFLDFRGHAGRTFQFWNVAFMAAIVLGFMTKTSMIFSRGTVVLLYIGGYIALVSGRYLLVRLVQIASKTGTVAARRIFLIGFEDEVIGFATRHQPWNLGMEIAGVAVIPRPAADSDDAAAEAIDEAVMRARAASPDDVFILMSWDKKRLIDQSIDRFLTIPASIHLGAEAILDRFHDVRISRIGTVSSVQLVRRPLSMGDVALKRVFDTIVGVLALVLLAPFFAAIALAIKLDSRGPVFFMQRRYGFNQQPFRIFKFRTMLTMDDGDIIKQATADDPRITKVGRFLRRFNLDELPQLINVLKGEMSLVGPRPHALAHDHAYERRIALYARRHNVKPGITGWAQVNGFRGETSTDAKMQARVEHDLHYIDNWSILMDMMIIVQTVVSPKAYRNAA